MESVTVTLLLLLAVVVSGFVVHLSRVPLPLPLVQIVVGTLLAYGSNLGIALEPEVFFLLFLPPLLFLDGWRIPKRSLTRDLGTILTLAIGLVVFTVLGMGLLIHWLIPTMPLAVAFALAAALSPTDPIAVSAVAARAPIPHRLMHILEGEALLNDASGLVCLRFAIAATLTGAFSLPEAFLTFLQLTLCGVAVGAVLALALGFVLDRLARRIGEDPGSRILVSLLVPFGAYLAAEHLHGSGILAAVAAGMVMNYVETLGGTLAATRIRGTAVWDTVQFAANGVIFVLLGAQLPSILSGVARSAMEAGHRDAWWLLLYVVAITAGLALLRFLWVWLSLRFVLLRAARRREVQRNPGWRLLATTSLAGAKGAVALAGILTLPLALPDGSPFPARDLAILLAMGVILLSLLVASVGLPRLLHGLQLPPQPAHQAEEDAARRAADRAAIRAIEQAQYDLAQGRGDADLYAEAAARVMEPYHQRPYGDPLDQEVARSRQRVEIERRLRLAGLKAARDALYRMRRAGRIEDEVLRRMVREIDLAEARDTG
ncbi:Na+/H+ antiporter [Siccirubricoccus sp. KC 17139]|uniref:Na+/H+ antiporter n=1 Tax=Siccirubricoccus soli TaxID=2899147 RepID=A0ABT1D4K1_9PROT|nr:Na+/H+ antiporter [Siccirubricoccus soli]MCO6416552.1 Na+/H+ antiporter [Siccirubricoccus soli]MCP2682687.1 Na+/H+ antiporter [Siccirubricoccus soli]